MLVGYVNIVYLCRRKLKLNNMEKLKEIYKDYLSKAISPEEALLQIRKTYLLTDEELDLAGLTLKYLGYGIYQLKQVGEYIHEGGEASCLEKASEILFKKH